MAVIQKTSFAKDLDRFNVLVNDVNPNSRYFRISELPDTLTGGKNAFLIAGSEELVPDTKIQIEIKDSIGNIIYHEPGEGMINTNISGSANTSIIAEYFEGVSKVVAIYIYPETTFGPCTLTILGEVDKYEDGNGILTPVPIDWIGKYNVKWQKQLNVNPSLANTTKIRFYQRPQAKITEILNPIYTIVSGSKVASAVTQSFANIKLSRLETFAGDVKRVKVFRTSDGDISDYDLIQDILVESKELLTSYTLSGSVVGQTGIITSETLKNYWNTGSLNAYLTSSKVESGVRLTGSGNFTYSSSLDIKSKNTYELGLDAFYSSSTSSNLGIYLSWVSSSTTFTSSLATLTGTQPTKNLLDTIIPFKIDRDYPSASLYFSQSQGEWHLGNISLKLSQDTAFSPDEISFVTTMPTDINNQTYNFKFEFYDVNNNYVPVAVTQSAVFTGGNVGATAKLLTFQTDRSAFRFSTGSYGNPTNQTVKFSTQKTNLTGSVTYASSAFDIGGNYITPASYAGTYPGTLTNVSDNGALLTIANFSGSVESVLVGSIVYTASCENFTEFETIYRFEDGDNAPGVFVTSNTNQFIYKATDLSLNPTGQTITIEAKRKNLASATTPLTVNSGSGKPPLTLVSTNATNGVDTYTLAGSTYPFGTNESIYFISGSDQFGNVFSDAIKITPVKILDGFSVAVSNENTSFPADSIGTIIGGLAASSGSITVKVGNETINYSSTFIPNSFSASISSTSGLTPNTFNGTNYSINALSQDSGSLTLLVKYKDGGGTIISSSKEITYSKVKKAAPVLEFVIGNNNQSTDSTSIGTQITAFANSSLSVKEQYNGVTSTLTLANAPTINSSSAFTPITKTTTNLTYPTLSAGTDSVELSITGSAIDSEGVSRNVFGNVSLTKIKKAAPVLAISSTPKDQSVTAKSTGAQIDSFADATIVVKETYNGVTSNLTITSLTATSSDITSISTTPSTGLITLNGKTLVDGVNSTTVTITAVVTDSEGVSRTITDTLSLSKVKKAVPNVVISATPQAQSVLANAAGTQTGTLSNVTVSALEGTTSRFTSMVATYTGFSTNPTISSATLTMTSAVMNAAEASATIVVTHTDSEGTTGQTQTIIVRFTKVNVGTDGNNGSNGTNAKVVVITADNYVVTYDGNGSLSPGGQSVILTATSQNFTTPYYQFTKNGTEVRAYSTTATYTIVTLPSSGTSDLYQVNVKEGNVGSVIAFDNTDIFGVKAGTDSYTVFLTNEAHTLPAANDGTVSSYVGSGTSVIVYKGATELNGVTTGTPTTGEFKVTATLTTGTITIGGQTSTGNPVIFAEHSVMTTDLVTITYSINVENLVTITKLQSLSKSKKGDTGSPGNNGNDGKRTATGLVYYQSVSATAPAKPTATVYTFSTNTFTTPTLASEGWAFGAPTFAAGNSNKYWYSTYTAVETTAGGNTAVPTFTTVTQAIGFTGLVTFTSPDNISDGSGNTSEIIPKGSITNHIGGANVTTINGSKISTGTITSTGYTLLGSDTLISGSYTGQGTIFNLDSGSIRSKNFYISKEGNAYFKGDITGASGTFSGTLRIGTTDLTYVPPSTTDVNTAAKTGGSVGGWSIDTSYIWTGTKKTTDGYSTDGITLASAGAIRAPKFYLTAAGDAYFKGDITGASGTFSGTVNVGGTDLTAANTLNANTTATNVGLGNVSNLTPQNQAQTGLIAGTTITGGGITLSGGGNIKGGQTAYNTGTGFFLGYSDSLYRFSIGNPSGDYLTYNGAGTLAVGGTINATAGVIGGWNIGGNKIYVTNKLELDAGATYPSINVFGSDGTPRVIINNSATLSSLTGGGAGSGTQTSANGGNSTSGTTKYFPPIDMSTVAGAVYNLAILFIESDGNDACNFSPVTSTGNINWGISIWNTALSTEGQSIYSDITNTVFSDMFWSWSDLGGINGIAAYANITGDGTTLKIRPYMRYNGSASSCRDITFPAFTYSWSQNVSKTEIIPGGMQVVNSSAAYLKADRTVTDSAGTPWMTSAGNWKHNGTLITTSDRNIKKNITPINFDLTKLNEIDGYSYDKTIDYDGDGNGDVVIPTYGIIAQEIETILPNAVTTNAIDGIKGVDYNAVTGMLLSAVKKLYLKVVELENRISGSI